MQRIYISDLDGTLLNSKAKLNENTKKELNELISNGVKFTIATARSIYSIKEIFEGVNLKLPVIEFNGSFITDIRTEKKLIVNNIQPDINNGIIELCSKYGQTPLISVFDGKDGLLYYKDSISAGMDDYIKSRKEAGDNRLVSLQNMDDIVKEKIICFTLINRKEILDDLIKKLIKLYGSYLNIYYNEDIYYKNWYWASIYSYNSKKGNAIKELIKLLDMQNTHITVFGDHYNDIDMFKMADTSVAVENAEKELKEHADIIIGKNIDDSVLKYIEDNSKSKI